MMKAYDKRVRDLLVKGVSDGVFPGAQLLVSKEGQMVLSEEAGYLSVIPAPVPMRKDAIYDLASLTKPLATTMAIMKLVDEGKIKLDQTLTDLLPIPSLSDKKSLGLRLILSHSAGFADWRPFYLDLIKYRLDQRKEILREWLIKEELEYEPGKGCIYSDLGFMILEWVIEEASGMPMHRYVENNIYEPLLLEKIFFGMDISLQFKEEMFAATEVCPWRKRVIRGEVHDENAFALGGYSGHAGLFGDVKSVFALLTLLMGHYCGERDDYFKQETVREFFKRQEVVPGCSRALGWDTPSPEDSSSGKYFSPNSVGHLGFTGTSIWMDLERDIIIIFLTNRVHPTRNNEKIKAFRPVLHDLIMEDLF